MYCSLVFIKKKFFSGVLWIDNNAIPGSADTMNYFRKLGKKIFYVTNNSTKIRSDFAAKAQQLGFIASQVTILNTYFAVSYISILINFKYLPMNKLHYSSFIIC